MSETISKLEPHRTMYMRGFDRRGCAASLNNATASGFTVSGVFSDQADFAVLVLVDADDQFGHLFTTRYLPDFSLAGVTVDFDLAITNAQNPVSRKFQSVPWGALSYITKSETPGTISLLPMATSATGMAAASQTFTVNGTPALYDRVDLVYLSNVVYDYLVSTTLSPGPSTVTFGFFNYLGTGYNHSITIGSNTYSHVQLSTDGSGDIAIALAAAINAANDPNATASVSANNVILTARTNSGASISCSASDGNGPGTLFESQGACPFIAAKLAGRINATNWAFLNPTIALMATVSGASFTVYAARYGTVNTSDTSVSFATGKNFLRVDVLPLPGVTGQAIANYLHKSRPTTESRAVFVRHRAPLDIPVGPSVVRSVVRQAAVRSGLAGRLHGPHRLRHSAATRMLQGGATLKVIADVMRHRSLDTTAIYAKVDLTRLSSIAQPWPGGAA